MPHVEIGVGTQTATTTDFQTARSLIPGIEPGGSRVGQPTKPALLIRDCWVEPAGVGLGSATSINQALWFLKLSQELTMDPGLILPIAAYGAEQRVSTSVGIHVYPLGGMFQDLFRTKGTIWAAKYVAVGVTEIGGISVAVNVHLEYDVVEIPWMEWFVKWDFLDHIVNNTRDF